MAALKALVANPVARTLEGAGDDHPGDCRGDEEHNHGSELTVKRDKHDRAAADMVGE